MKTNRIEIGGKRTPLSSSIEHYFDRSPSFVDSSENDTHGT